MVSVCVLAQAPPHSIWPVGHIAAPQVPPVQVWPVVHAWPQAPQFATSVMVFVQVPLQAVWPVGHVVVAMHAPLTQLCPALHAVPQAPQFVASVLVSVHVPAQRVWPVVVQGIGVWQLPPVQLSPVAQALPQDPQFDALFCVFTQSVPHRVRPVPQLPASGVCTSVVTGVSVVTWMSVVSGTSVTTTVVVPLSPQAATPSITAAIQPYLAVFMVSPPKGRRPPPGGPDRGLPTSIPRGPKVPPPRGLSGHCSPRRVRENRACAARTLKLGLIR